MMHDKNPSQNKVSVSNVFKGVASGTQTEFHRHAPAMTVYNQVSIKNQTLNITNAGEELHGAPRLIIGNFS